MVSVVVASYRRPDGVRRLVDALARQTYRPFELVVVDQTDDPEVAAVVDAVTAFPARFVTCVPDVPADRRGRPPSNASRARNHGVEMSVAESAIVAFTDDDCVPAPQWLERLTLPLRRDPDCVLVAGPNTTVPNDYDPDVEVRRAGRQRPQLIHAQGGASSLAVRRDVFDAVGGFDVRFGPGTSVPGAEDQKLIYEILGWAATHDKWCAGRTDACVDDSVPDGRLARMRRAWRYMRSFGVMLRTEAREHDDTVAADVLRTELRANRAAFGEALRARSPFWVATIPVQTTAIVAGWWFGEPRDP
jgi:glycosyltransferase involved in cell wall biosynthesis